MHVLLAFMSCHFCPLCCRCGYEFCYTCGAEWKDKKATCDCPLWDERNILHDYFDEESDDYYDSDYDSYGEDDEYGHFDDFAPRDFHL